MLDLQRRGLGGVGLRLGDVVRLRPSPAAPALRRARGERRVQERVVVGRRLRQPREQRRLRRGSAARPACRRTSATPRRRRSPSAPPTVPYGTSFRYWSRIQSLVCFFSSCSASLAWMILYLRLWLTAYLVPSQVAVVDQLHRQRRGPLERAAAAEDVLDPGAEDALVVERAVLVEAAVLDRDRRLLERSAGSGSRGTGVAERVRVDVAEQRAVGREHLRTAVPRIARLELVEVGRRVGDRDDPADREQRRQQQPRTRRPGALIRSTRLTGWPRLRRRWRCRSRRLIEVRCRRRGAGARSSG